MRRWIVVGAVVALVAAWLRRSMTGDPEWKYVNVRPVFIFLEHSIDKAISWVVYEPNGQSRWTRPKWWPF